MHKGANPNATDEGLYPLTSAITYNHPETVKYLVEHGAIVDRGDILEAINNYNLPMIKYLVEHAPDIQEYIEVPIRMALRLNRPEIVEYLISIRN